MEIYDQTRVVQKLLGFLKIFDMDYSGMTVNERLVVSGLDKEFDKSVKNRNRNKVITILGKINLDRRSIEDILNKYNM